MIPDNDADMIQDFRQFVKEKVEAEPEGGYDFQSVNMCAFAQYLDSRQEPYRSVLIYHWIDHKYMDQPIPEYLVPLLGVDRMDYSQFHRWTDLLDRIDTGEPAE